MEPAPRRERVRRGAAAAAAQALAESAEAQQVVPKSTLQPKCQRLLFLLSLSRSQALTAQLLLRRQVRKMKKRQKMALPVPLAAMGRQREGVARPRRSRVTSTATRPSLSGQAYQLRVDSRKKKFPATTAVVAGPTSTRVLQTGSDLAGAGNLRPELESAGVGDFCKSRRRPRPGRGRRASLLASGRHPGTSDAATV